MPLFLLIVAAKIVVVMLLAVGPVLAVQLNDRLAIEVTGRVFTQASLRMEDSDSDGRDCFFSMTPGTRCSGFTFPDTQAGQLIQNRNLLDIEIAQDIAHWLGAQLLWLDRLSYRFRVKYYYEGVYDYGPRGYSEPSSHLEPNGQPDTLGQQGLRDNRHLNTQHDPIWNAYIDAAKGPLWLRVGRQDLSWGETDGFRLLDMIEPLDNRFGFALVEDLDDRRIPLWMLRSSLSVPSPSAAISNIVLDGYWVPGTIDNQESPVPPPGNPFGPPVPPIASDISVPAKTWSNSRGGGRLLGTLFDNVTVSLGHYVTFNDVPSARLAIRALAPLDTPFLAEFYQQQVTGGSATLALPFDPLTILRGEVAQFWNEHVFIPEESANLTQLLQDFLAGGGQPVAGALPKRNVLRWVIGVDRNLWLRWLNPSHTFFFSAQYFHSYIFDYDSRTASPIAAAIEYPVGAAPEFVTVSRKQNELIFTYLLSTLYEHGTIAPQIFGAYDPRGAQVVVPSLTYQWGTNIQFTLKYAVITGKFVGFGILRDRDQLLFRVQYNLS